MIELQREMSKITQNIEQNEVKLKHKRAQSLQTQLETNELLLMKTKAQIGMIQNWFNLIRFNLFIKFSSEIITETDYK